MIIVYRYRVKNLSGELDRQARAVNFVWNYCNDVQKQALRWSRRWPSRFDLNKLTAGSCRELRIRSTTVNGVCERYAKSRQQHRRPFLRYRGRKSLGWIPFRGEDVAVSGDGFRFAGLVYRVFKSRPLPDACVIKDGGSFSSDSRGRWYLNIPVEVSCAEPRTTDRAVGIDLGLNALASLSTGETIPCQRHFRVAARRLGIAQRANKRRTAAKAHAGIANARRDFLHKLSTRLVGEFDVIAVGNVNAKGLAKGRMAKSVHDAGWAIFRNMLAYKAIRHGARYVKVDERFTSQACSSCGLIPCNSPKGMGALGIRRWTCGGCGAIHDRDVNAAINILARSGHRAPVEGAGGQRPCQRASSFTTPLELS